MCDFTKNSNFNQINHKNKSFNSFIILINSDTIIIAKYNSENINFIFGEVKIKTFLINLLLMFYFSFQ